MLRTVFPFHKMVKQDHPVSTIKLYNKYEEKRQHKRYCFTCLFNVSTSRFTHREPKFSAVCRLWGLKQCTLFWTPFCKNDHKLICIHTIIEKFTHVAWKSTTTGLSAPMTRFWKSSSSWMLTISGCALLDMQRIPARRVARFWFKMVWRGKCTAGLMAHIKREVLRRNGESLLNNWQLAMVFCKQNKKQNWGNMLKLWNQEVLTMYWWQQVS